MSNRPRQARGFTLIEMMIVVVIAGILASIALPSYFQYIQRSKIIEATTGLSNLRTRLEQFFLDNRTYVGSCTLVLDSIQKQVQSFALTCDPAPDVSTYLLTATGKSDKGMAGFIYTVNQNDVKATTGLPSGWATPSGPCWVTRKDGTCG